MDLEDIFATNLQVRLIKIFLENPSKIYSSTALARALSSSPSAVISRLKVLERLGIVKGIRINRMKIYKLNQNNEAAKLLREFYLKLKELQNEKLKSGITLLD